jgi:phage-related protein
MPAALPLTEMISQSSPGRYKNRVLRSQFGDGYEQSTVDGINATLGQWDLSYENLNETEYDTLIAALDAVGSWDYLTWQSPFDAGVKRWKVTDDGISINAVSGELYNISFTLRQVP